MNPDSERFNYDVKHEGDDPTNIFNIYQKDGDEHLSRLSNG